MESLFCLFCARCNPGDARFCNECGTPLDLKPCRQCDAVNARSADRCYRCEAALPTEAPATATGVAAPPEIEQPAVEPSDVVAQAGGALAALEHDWQAPTPRAAGVANEKATPASAAQPIVPQQRTAWLSETAVASAAGSWSSRADAAGRVSNDASGDVSEAVVEEASAPGEASNTARIDDRPSVPIDPRGSEPAVSVPPARDARGVRLSEDGEVAWHVDTERLPDVGTTGAPVYRPPRPRLLAALMLALAIGAGAVAVYVSRHPDSVDWIASRIGVPADRAATSAPAPQAQAPATEAPPPVAASGTLATPPDAAPAPPTSGTVPEAAGAAVPDASGAAAPRADSADAGSDPARVGGPAQATTEPAAPAASAGAVTPGAGATSRPRTATSSGAGRDATSTKAAKSASSKSRDTRSGAQRSAKSTAAPSRAASQPAPARAACTPAVAALGLCTP